MTDGTTPTPSLPKKKKKKHKIHHRPPSSVSAGAARADINITPLVDVVLVLLIIFMVVTPMLHRGVQIKLPETVHHDQRQDTGEQLIVSGELEISDVYVDEGASLMTYLFTDIYNQTYWSEPVA